VFGIEAKFIPKSMKRNHEAKWGEIKWSEGEELAEK
jgi:hypothetical protein